LQQQQQPHEPDVIPADSNENIDRGNAVHRYSQPDDTSVQTASTTLSTVGVQTSEPPVQQQQQQHEAGVCSVDKNENIDSGNDVHGYTPLGDNDVQPGSAKLSTVGAQTAEPAVQLQQQQKHETDVNSTDKNKDTDNSNDVHGNTQLGDTDVQPGSTTLNTVGAETAEPPAQLQEQQQQREAGISSVDNNENIDNRNDVGLHGNTQIGENDAQPGSTTLNATGTETAEPSTQLQEQQQPQQPQLHETDVSSADKNEH